MYVTFSGKLNVSDSISLNILNQHNVITKVKMKIAFTDKERVLRSPYYKCNRLWDQLSTDIQTTENIFEFKAKLKKIDMAELYC